jgi:hypothetical protein
MNGFIEKMEYQVLSISHHYSEVQPYLDGSIDRLIGVKYVVFDLPCTTTLIVKKLLQQVVTHASLLLLLRGSNEEKSKEHCEEHS